jgi:acyl-CoA reductase-like NAD-dependent aldehyde dehydrogenase
VRLVPGDVAVSTALLKLEWQLIFFTGSTRVGKIVMKAAAEFLTPVVLELGGKCPVIIDRDCDLEVSARRVLWAKFTNNGQMCVAPDYVLITPDIQTEFESKLKQVLIEFFGGNPKDSDDLSRIVNEFNAQRLATMLQPIEGNKEFEVLVGGIQDCDVSQRYIPPTILTRVKPTARVMEDEIFGPILPILTVQNVDEAIQFINARDKPLALYVFSNNSSVVEKVLNSTSSGGVCVNDCVFHMIDPSLPFGGVGASGMGSYHGRKGFDTFVHRKPVLHRIFMFDSLVPRYVPQSESDVALIGNTAKCIRCCTRWQSCRRRFFWYD